MSKEEELRHRSSIHLSQKHQKHHKHHMAMPWHDFIPDDDHDLARTASLPAKAAVVGRVGLMMLSCGTGAWRVRDSMNIMARKLGLVCSADIGLISIEFTCIDKDGQSYTQALSLPTTGVNTDKLTRMEHFVKRINRKETKMTLEEIHDELDKIQATPGNYKPYQVGLASALACCAFVFLLGGGIIEMIGSFIGAGLGNYTRRKMLDKHITLLACVAVSVMVACLSYTLSFHAMELLFNVAARHEAGYIGAMLFVIPGFPFITSGLDIAKMDMRSGLERLAHAIVIIGVATLVGWVTALVVHLQPENFMPLQLTVLQLMFLRVIASFCGVYGFSIMFNSPRKMASIAGCIGAVANTLRLELVDLCGLAPGVAAFFGALTAGLLASYVYKRMHYPRISLTVPSIVIMVPGLYMYRAIYNIGVTSISDGALWLTKALLIVMFLPLGLIVARIITDDKWRYCN